MIKEYVYRLVPGRVLTVIGRAGAGKTSFVKQLLEHSSLPHSWIFLRKISSSVITFVTLLEMRCGEVWPGVRTERDVSAGDLETLAFSRVEELLDSLNLEARNPGVLVFDNWEVVREDDLRNRLLNLWLERMPEFAATVIISRRDLRGVNLSRLRTAGQLLEVGEEEVRFDLEETEEFLSGLVDLALSGERLKEIYGLTRGWPVALYLLGQRLKSQGPFAPPQREGLEAIFHYLQEEFWGGIPPRQRRALVYLSLLGPFDGEMIEGILPEGIREEATEVLGALPSYLEMTEEGRAFHPLFADFLRGKVKESLTEEEKRSFHRRAARFFQDYGFPFRAMRHAFLTGDEEWAGRIFGEHYPRWKEKGDLEVAVGLAAGFSSEFLDRHPDISAALGEACIFLGRVEEAIEHLSRAYLHSSHGKGRGEVGCRLAEANLLAGRHEEAALLCEEMLGELPRVSPQRVEAQLLLAIAYNQLNRGEESERLWKRVEGVARSKVLPIKGYRRCYLLLPKAVFYHLDRSEFKRAEEIVDYAIEVLKKEDPQHRRGWALLFKGVLKREQHQYEDAAFWLREAVAASAKENRSVYALSLSMLALTMAERDAEDVLFWLQRAKDNQSFDRSLWAHCLVELAEAHMEPSSAARRIAAIYGLSSEKDLTYIQALSAFTAFRLREIMPREQVLYYLEQVIEAARRLKIKHREARALLYLWALSPESTESHRWAQRALGLLREHKLGFLLTDDPHFDGLSLARWALQLGIETEYLLYIWPRWGERGMEALMELFPSLPLEIKRKVVKLWEGMGYGPARPLLLQEGERAADASLRRLCRGAIRALDRLPPEPLHVKLLGGFSLLRGTRPVSQWRRQRSKDLFKYLVLHRGKPIPSDVLLDVFWPDFDPEKARTNLWSTVSALRAALEPELPPKAKSKYLLIEKEAYQLRLPEGSTVDVDVFERAAAEGLDAFERGDEVLVLRRLEEAIRCYPGDLLPEDVYKDWTEEPRDHLQRLFNEALKCLGRVYLRRQELSPAIKILSRLLARDALDEEAYYLLMKAHLLRGEEVQAIKVYRRCEESLEREMGISPSSELRLLYERIMERRSREAGLPGAGAQGLPLRFP